MDGGFDNLGMRCIRFLEGLPRALAFRHIGRSANNSKKSPFPRTRAIVSALDNV